MPAFPSHIDLSSLPAADGFIIQGDAVADRAGGSVSSAGDVNGDGIDDLIVGAPSGDDGGDFAGEAYVIFGTRDGFSTIDLGDLNARGFVIQGDMADDYAGTSVSAAGDINGDGIDDLIVGASLGDDGGTNSGEAYVIFGSAEPFDTIDLSTLTAAQGFIIQGAAAGDQAGVSVSAAGDINGDDIDDLVVGANLASGTGEAYVIFGSIDPFSTIDLNGLTAPQGFVIQGDAVGDRAGFSVSEVGDINDDDIDDLIVGARAGGDGGGFAGEAYVIFGSTDPFGTIDLSTLTTAQGFIIQGDEAGDNAGWSVSAAGDINGDGIDDLIVGAYYGDIDGSDSGEAYVIFGSGDPFDNIDLSDLTAAQGFLIRGVAAGDAAGASVSAAGDVNGDGIDDLIVGAPNGGGTAGEAYIIFGSGDDFGTIDLALLTAEQGVVIQGEATYDAAGASVSAAGDVNGDGIDDVIIGAPGNEGGDDENGAAYVIFGRVADIPAVAQDDAASTNENARLNGNVFADSGFGPDSDADGPALAVAAVNGQAANVGAAFKLPSGARLRVNADGNFSYDPDGRFDHLQPEETGTETPSSATDSFTYTLQNGNTATVTLTIAAVDGSDAIEGTKADDVLFGGSGKDRLVGRGGNDELDGGSGNDRLSGDGGNDELIGGSARDHLEGGVGEDSLFGGDDMDFLDGGKRADLMEGGDGNDTYRVDHVGDVVVEQGGGGKDLVLTTISYRLPDHVENLTLLGGGDLSGRGNGSDNKIVGNGGDNYLAGYGGDDRIEGGDGDDTILGGSGLDTLIGGSGSDDFVFNATPAQSNTGRIYDFASGEDRFVLDEEDFAAIGPGSLSSAAFQLGATAQDADDRILYDEATGNIFYDPDGSGAGATIMFAAVSAGTLIVHSDFFVG